MAGVRLLFIFGIIASWCGVSAKMNSVTWTLDAEIVIMAISIMIKTHEEENIHICLEKCVRSSPLENMTCEKECD